MVARFLPRVVLRLHDMAVDTNLGIVAEIGQTFRARKPTDILTRRPVFSPLLAFDTRSPQVTR
jgi:hypothetical protein